MVNRAISNRWVRATVGLAVSTGFLAVTLSRLDLALMADAWAGLAGMAVVLAIAVSFIEVAVRAARWQLLLRPLHDPGYPVTLAFLSIGHLANAVLPARLGDVARALTASSYLRVSRASVLGTIAVERIADVLLLALAATGGAMLGATSLGTTVGVLVAGALVAILAVLAGSLVIRRPGVSNTRSAKIVLHHWHRFVAGAAAFRSARAAAGIGLLTVSSFGLAVLMMQLAGTAVGLSLSLADTAVVIAAVTLSTAIPAGPASVGTYEFVGMTVMVSMGFPPEPSLLAVAVVHGVATLVPALLGVVAMWVMGLRPISLTRRPRVSSSLLAQPATSKAATGNRNG